MKELTSKIKEETNPIKTSQYPHSIKDKPCHPSPTNVEGIFQRLLAPSIIKIKHSTVVIQTDFLPNLWSNTINNRFKALYISIAYKSRVNCPNPKANLMRSETSIICTNISNLAIFWIKSSNWNPFRKVRGSFHQTHGLKKEKNTMELLAIRQKCHLLYFIEVSGLDCIMVELIVDFYLR